MKWSYGVTTVLSRKNTFLSKTLASLSTSGFDKPTLFLDRAGHNEARALEVQYDLDVVNRSPGIGTFGNWLLALLELYLREPNQDRYAIFQDDIICCKNLRTYLEVVPYPPKSYLNLCLWSTNLNLIPVNIRADRVTGFFPSNQLGHGAQGLVFSRDAVLQLLTYQEPTIPRHADTKQVPVTPRQTAVDYLMKRPRDAHRTAKSVDGGVVMAMKRAGYREYVHNPSLIYHTAYKQGQGTMGNPPHPETVNWLGEEWNPLELLRR